MKRIEHILIAFTLVMFVALCVELMSQLATVQPTLQIILNK